MKGDNERGSEQGNSFNSLTLVVFNLLIPTAQFVSNRVLTVLKLAVSMKPNFYYHSSAPKELNLV